MRKHRDMFDGVIDAVFFLCVAIVGLGVLYVFN